MKRNVLIIILLLITVIITGCGNNKNTNKEMQSMELNDYRYGTVKFYYPKSLSFSVKQIDADEGSVMSVISHDYLVNVNMFFDYDVNDNYNEMIDNCKKTKAYKEYTWNNKYKAISCGDEKEVSFIIKTYESEIGYIRYFTGTMRFENNQNGNMISVFNEKGIQDWLNTIEYKE